MGIPKREKKSKDSKPSKALSLLLRKAELEDWNTFIARANKLTPTDLSTLFKNWELVDGLLDAGYGSWLLSKAPLLDRQDTDLDLQVQILTTFVEMLDHGDVPLAIATFRSLSPSKLSELTSPTEARLAEFTARAIAIGFNHSLLPNQSLAIGKGLLSAAGYYFERSNLMADRVRIWCSLAEYSGLGAEPDYEAACAYLRCAESVSKDLGLKRLVTKIGLRRAEIDLQRRSGMVTEKQVRDALKGFYLERNKNNSGQLARYYSTLARALFRSSGSGKSECERALRLYDSLGGKFAGLELRFRLARLTIIDGDYLRSIKHLREVREIAAQSGFRFGLISSLLELAPVASKLSLTEELDQTLDLLEKQLDVPAARGAAASIAQLLLATNRTEIASKFCEVASAQMMDLSNLRGYSSVLGIKAEIEYQRQNFKIADLSLRKAAMLDIKLGDGRSRILRLKRRIEMVLMREDKAFEAESKDLFAVSDRLLNDIGRYLGSNSAIGEKKLQAEVLSLEAQLRLAQGSFTEALRAIDRAREIYQESGNLLEHAVCLIVSSLILERVAAQQSSAVLEESFELYSKAIEELDKLESLGLQWRARYFRARVAIKLSEVAYSEADKEEYLYKADDDLFESAELAQSGDSLELSGVFLFAPLFSVTPGDVVELAANLHGEHLKDKDLRRRWFDRWPRSKGRKFYRV